MAFPPRYSVWYSGICIFKKLLWSSGRFKTLLFLSIKYVSTRMSSYPNVLQYPLGTVPQPPTDTKTRGCSSPSYKMAQYLCKTYSRTPVYFKLSLDYSQHLTQCKCYLNSCWLHHLGNIDQKVCMFSTDSIFVGLTA